MSYNYQYGVESEEGFLAVLIYYLICMVFGGGMGIVLYVFRSLGVYTIAKRRDLNHPWLAWIPVADAYLLGCVSDQYRYVVKGENKSKRKWLLALNIVLGILTVAMTAMALGTVIRVAGAAMRGAGENRIIHEAMRSVMGILGLSLPMFGVGIAAAVLRFMALYDLYTAADPRNNVMYLVLSILFQVTEPFFIFFNRHKDEGMPPRRNTDYTQPVQEAPMWTDPVVEEPESWQRPDAE